MPVIFLSRKRNSFSISFDVQNKPNLCDVSIFLYLPVFTAKYEKIDVAS